jgi:hypothetical protein
VNKRIDKFHTRLHVQLIVSRNRSRVSADFISPAAATVSCCDRSSEVIDHTVISLSDSACREVDIQYAHSFGSLCFHQVTLLLFCFPAPRVGAVGINFSFAFLITRLPLDPIVQCYSAPDPDIVFFYFGCVSRAAQKRAVVLRVRSPASLNPDQH